MAVHQHRQLFCLKVRTPAEQRVPLLPEHVRMKQGQAPKVCYVHVVQWAACSTDLTRAFTMAWLPPRGNSRQLLGLYHSANMKATCGADKVLLQGVHTCPGMCNQAKCRARRVLLQGMQMCLGMCHQATARTACQNRRCALSVSGRIGGSGSRCVPETSTNRPGLTPIP